MDQSAGMFQSSRPGVLKTALYMMATFGNWIAPTRVPVKEPVSTQGYLLGVGEQCVLSAVLERALKLAS